MEFPEFGGSWSRISQRLWAARPDRVHTGMTLSGWAGAEAALQKIAHDGMAMVGSAGLEPATSCL